MIDASARSGRTVGVRITTVDGLHTQSGHDELATEEPLEFRLRIGSHVQTLAVTMRTPGHDFELAAGFAFSEGIVANRAQLAQLSYCVDAERDAAQRYNVVNLDLLTQTLPDMARYERHFTMNSSCGVCGRAQLDALRERGLTPIRDRMRVSTTALYGLPERMHEAQHIFASTGGLHAAGLFGADGEMIVVREDIGRHNAVDKLIGWALLNARTPLKNCILLVSGRTSYEILQKAIVARIPIVAGVSAPSSLAVELAKTFGVTLIGFLRAERANIYAHDARISSGSRRP
ncbi:MAG: formate dehydrogenase accessory sulfurtransferase FdhD [Vulcanimicrobiaceae bacterium]